MWSQHCVAAGGLSFTNSFYSLNWFGGDKVCKSLIQLLFWSCSSQVCLEGARNGERGIKTSGIISKEDHEPRLGLVFKQLKAVDAGADVVGQGFCSRCKAGTGLHWGGVVCSLLAGKSGEKHLFGVIAGVFPVSLSGFSRSAHSPFPSALLLLGTNHPQARKFLLWRAPGSQIAQ